MMYNLLQPVHTTFVLFRSNCLVFFSPFFSHTFRLGRQIHISKNVVVTSSFREDQREKSLCMRNIIFDSAVEEQLKQAVVKGLEIGILIGRQVGEKLFIERRGECR